MGYIPLDGIPHPELSREKLAVRVAEQALRINEKLLAGSSGASGNSWAQPDRPERTATSPDAPDVPPAKARKKGKAA